MQMLYHVHYTDGDPLDYRTIMRYTLSVPDFEDAEFIMETLKKEGKNPVLVCSPIFDEELTQK